MKGVRVSMAQWTRRRIELALLRSIQQPLYKAARWVLQFHATWSERWQGTALAWLSKPLVVVGGVLFVPLRR